MLRYLPLSKAFKIHRYSGPHSQAKRDYLHIAVAERGNMQVVETFLPIIHLVFPSLKTWLLGTHHGVSPQHFIPAKLPFMTTLGFHQK